MRLTKIAYVYSQQIIGTKKAFISEYDFGVKLKLHIHILQIFEQNVIPCYI
jgi:hypothetical protein